MSSTNPLGDFWNAWANLGRAPEPAPAVPGWKEGLQWWSQLAGQGRDGIDATVERMNAQAGQWFGQMQNLATAFAGREAAPGDVAAAWRNALGGNEGNPVADMFRRMSGGQAHGMDAWLAQVQPFLGTLQGESQAWLSAPAFGPSREHQERAQKLMQAQLEYQQRTADYNAQLEQAAKGAFERFEKKLAERAEPGRQVESARALFDLWIDAAEESWAEIALSPEFRRVYAGMVNAQMRLRLAVQAQIEQAATLLGLPTRSELNGSHRKLAALEREVRALRQQLAAYDREDEPPPVTGAAKKNKKKPSPARKTVLPTVEAPRAAHAKPRKGR